MKKLVLITTGGTISSVYDPQKGYAPALGAEKLLGGKPLPIADTQVEVIPFAAILSFAMTPEMILSLVELAEEKAAQHLPGDGHAGGVTLFGRPLLAV